MLVIALKRVQGEPDTATSIVAMNSPLFEPLLSIARQQMLLLGSEPGRVLHGRDRVAV